MEQLVGVQVGLSLIKVSLPNFIYRQVIGEQNRWINCMKNEHTDSRKKRNHQSFSVLIRCTQTLGNVIKNLLIRSSLF